MKIAEIADQRAQQAEEEAQQERQRAETGCRFGETASCARHRSWRTLTVIDIGRLRLRQGLLDF